MWLTRNVRLSSALVHVGRCSCTAPSVGLPTAFVTDPEASQGRQGQLVMPLCTMNPGHDAISARYLQA